MKLRIFCVIIAIFTCFVHVTESVAQQPVRVFGAGGLFLDNRTTPVRGVTLLTPTTLTFSYSLQWPDVAPSAPVNVLVADADGFMHWSSGQSLLPSLPPGNIWVGNPSGQAMPYAPTGPGQILALDASNKPVWTNVLPLNTTVSFDQITSGTLPPGTTINVGPGSSINLTGGSVIADQLGGAGVNKYSGTVAIPLNATGLDISYTGIKAGAAIQFSINDPNLPGIIAFMDNLTPGAGFHLTFSAAYPDNTGILSYVAINP